MWMSQPHCKSYDWMPCGVFGGIWSSLYGDASILLPRTTTGCPGAGVVGFGCCLRVSSSFHLQRTTTGCRGVRWVGFGCKLICIRHSKLPKYASGCRGAGLMNVGCTLCPHVEWSFQSHKLRLHALGRVWLGLDVASSVYHSTCKEVRMDAMWRVEFDLNCGFSIVS